MINWYSVVINALWILGCAIILAVFSYADWLTSLRRVRLRDLLGSDDFLLFLCGGMILICPGLLLASRCWWEYIAWGLLTALLAGQYCLAWRGRGGRGDSMDGG